MASTSTEPPTTDRFAPERDVYRPDSAGRTHLIALDALLTELHTSVRGLTAAEAARRLSQFGPNDSAPTGRGRSLAEFVRISANPLVLILLVAAGVSALLGQIVDSAIIATIVVVSAALDFIQTYRSERAVLRLRDQVAPSATVLRDGKWVEIPRRDIVPGDVLQLSAGDLVPADAHLIESRDLHVQQAALTGESMPVEKNADDASGAASGPERPNMVFNGTSVVSGTATAVVVATGRATAFGDIAMALTARRPETEFDRGTRRFGMLIMQTVFFLVMFIVIVNISLHRDPLDSILFALALAVGLTPEFLPMITTITLAAGAIAMARKSVIVKHLAAIQNFGSIDILCSDKTGTLTAGVMTLDRSLQPLGEPSERPLELAYLNSRLETGIKSPLDAAILAREVDGTGGYEKTDEIPFDFERRRLSVVVRKGDSHLLITKGAPEHILGICTTLEIDGATRPLADAERKRCREIFEHYSAEGSRILAVAYRAVERAAGLTPADESEMTLAGFLSFRDPPLDDAAESIAALRKDGVRIKVLTGDNDLVARHVCDAVGIEGHRVVLGDEIDRLSDAALGNVAERVNVFARVSPAQKNRIIRALKNRGHVVGFIGDGINDAPSMHTADVGISVAGAVDVAKDAADIILLERHLKVLHSGIIEGRKAFGNVFKYLLMGTSSNFGNMFSMAGAAVFLPFLPMLPMQILLNNFLYDLAQVTIPTDNVDPAYIRKPQRWDVRLIRDFMLLVGPVSSIYDFLTFYILLKVFQSTESQFHTGWFVESLATQTLVVIVIRTVGRPWSNPPSIPLVAAVLAVVATGVALPFTSLGGPLGFTPLPLAYFGFLLAATITYLGLVEVLKRRLMARTLRPAHRPPRLRPRKPMLRRSSHQD